uniref:Uncharacterized protein n=1 Tax=Physcomitrium patens TaxID=3218 RepID=A0A7I4DP01_PHYPA
MSLGSFLIDLESFDVSTLTVTFSSGGQLRITCADPNYNIATRTNKRENRVFPIFSAELDGGYSKFQSSGQLPGSKCFMGRLLEKALLVFVKSKLDDCGDLSVAVGGSNWDILGGNVKRIEVSVKQAIYKGVVLSEVGLTASNVRAELGRNRLFHQPFNVNAKILIREQDLNTSLTSPVMSSSFKDILPDEFQPLQVLYDDGNLRFSRSDKQSGRYDEIEYPIILKVDVEEGGEVISLKTSKTGSPKKAFKVGPDVRITDFQVGSSLLSLTGEFIYMP